MLFIQQICKTMLYNKGRKVNSVFEQHRTPTEELKELYLETWHPEVLDRLIKKAGYMVLLDLDVKGLELFSNIVFVQHRSNLLFSIGKVGELRRLFNYTIERFLSPSGEDEDEPDTFSEGVLEAIEKFDWEGGRFVSKNLIEERYKFIIKLLLSEKNNTSRKYSYYKELLDAVVKNQTISNEVILEYLLPEVPDLGRVLIKYATLRLRCRNDIFTIIDMIGKVKDVLFKVQETGGMINIDEEIKQGIDDLLSEDITQEVMFGIFVSIERIATQIIYYRLDEFILFFERFTLMFKEYKDNVEFYIENSNEQEGLFPLGDINDEISKESLDGLAYCLYHGATISDYNIVRDDRFLMETLDQVARSVGLYMYMKILPLNWLDSDEYYNILTSKENDVNNPIVSNDLDVSELLEGLGD